MSTCTSEIRKRGCMLTYEKKHATCRKTNMHVVAVFARRKMPRKRTNIFDHQRCGETLDSTWLQISAGQLTHSYLSSRITSPFAYHALCRPTSCTKCSTYTGGYPFRPRPWSPRQRWGSRGQPCRGKLAEYMD